MKKVALIILDGWGIATKPEVSAIDNARTPTFRALINKYANATLEASGLAVGLPEGQMGNSEVGHMNLGAGRIVYQDLVKINLACQDGSLGQQEELMNALSYVKQTGKKLHLIGLVSDGGVHSHISHLKGLLSVCWKQQVDNVFVHAFTDGRDTDPKGGLAYIQDLQQHMALTTGKLATVCGRYYAMDRDKRWERVKLAYDAMVNGIGEAATSATDAIQKSYAANVTDEFIKPIILTENGAPTAVIEEGDAVVCFNFRTDRGRQISQALCQKDFPEFGMHHLNLYYVTMTIYDESFQNVHVIYGKDNLDYTLGQVLSAAGRTQIRIAETEKYPHVTFFFNGGREEPFDGERRLLVPSPKVATYDLKPEMSAYELTDAIVPEIEAESADFICLNFANPDMVGHTGVWEAAIKAVETVDSCLKRVTDAALAHGYTCLIIADHGNSDMMINEDGSPNTAHTTNLVPLIVAGAGFEKTANREVRSGVLGDIAPTILKLMEGPQPAAMTGRALI